MTEIDDRDRELAGALGEVLSASDQDAFMQQIMNRVDDSGLLNTAPWWNVLDTWARPGMVAAAAGIILLGAIVSSNRPDRSFTSLAEGLSDDIAATELAESAPPNPESMMAVAFAID